MFEVASYYQKQLARVFCYAALIADFKLKLYKRDENSALIVFKSTCQVQDANKGELGANSTRHRIRRAAFLLLLLCTLFNPYRHNWPSFDPMKVKICCTLGDKIVPIKLDLRVNSTLIKDQFLWDMNNFDSDP
ncbi:hypothetical protein OIU84_018363 [Salix udensis]|uniref:Uncharacterized protein n=1 Tax=Salix udensis TaxID=889485 RepID=A0AAD6PIB2_9ROSI|nr:hypothetical protein OIU84_018363 [Salix udensis]